MDYEQIPLAGMLVGEEQLEGCNFKIEFHWISIDGLKEIEVYPTNISELLERQNEGIQHFVYREE